MLLDIVKLIVCLNHSSCRLVCVCFFQLEVCLKCTIRYFISLNCYRMLSNISLSANLCRSIASSYLWPLVLNVYLLFLSACLVLSCFGLICAILCHLLCRSLASSRHTLVFLLEYLCSEYPCVSNFRFFMCFVSISIGLSVPYLINRIA